MKKLYYVMFAVFTSVLMYETDARVIVGESGEVIKGEPDFSDLPTYRDESSSGSYSSDPRWAKTKDGYALKHSDGSLGKSISSKSSKSTSYR
ncbi:MAG: hypothetical protein LBF44_02790 [Holosporaceae bacterium]|jgi:hypothetical protein|nr:hypothetical protein [Holosporaceae bacterium]